MSTYGVKWSYSAVQVHVTTRHHGHPRGRGELPEWRGPRELRALGGGGQGKVLHARPETPTAALVEGAITHHRVGDTGGHGHGGLDDGSAGGAAAVVDAAEVTQRSDAHVAGDLDVGVVIGAVGDHAVDVGRLQSGVGDGGGHGLAGQTHLAAPGVLGELGGADTGDGGLATQLVAGSVDAHGNTTSTVAFM